MILGALEEDRDAVAVRQLGERTADWSPTRTFSDVIAGADAEGEQRADVHREEEAGARRVGIVRVVALHVVSAAGRSSSRNGLKIGLNAQSSVEYQRTPSISSST